MCFVWLSFPALKMVLRFTWEKTFPLAAGKKHRLSWTVTIAQSSPSEYQPKHMPKGHDISAQSESSETPMSEIRI